MMSSKEIPLQPMQANLLLAEKLHSHLTNQYGIVLEIKGNLEISLFQEALGWLIKKHEILRGAIKYQRSIPSFTILEKPGAIPFTYLETKEPLPKPIADNYFENLTLKTKIGVFGKKFNLTKGPLWHCCLIKSEEKRYQCIFLFNSMIIDDESIRILMNDFTSFYNQLFQKGNTLSIACAPLELTTPHTHNEINSRALYWEKNLKDLKSLTLHTDFIPSGNFQCKGKKQYFYLKNETINLLKRQELLNDTPVRDILLTTLYALLYRYSGDSDFCIGISTTNRTNEKVKNTVNCYANNLPIRMNFEPAITFKELLSAVKNKINDSLANELPFNEILQRISTINKIIQPNLFFNIILSFNKEKSFHFKDTETSHSIELDLGETKLPFFALKINEIDGNTYQGLIEYNAELFKEQTIEKFIERFQYLLTYFLNHPTTCINEAPILLEEERKSISTLNDTYSKPKVNQLIGDFFHQQALDASERTAIIYHTAEGEKLRLNYASLDKSSTQLANYLRSKGIKKNDIVGVAIKTSIPLIVSILATFKCGATLLVLEHKNSSLLEHQLASTLPHTILINKESNLQLKSNSHHIFDLDDLNISNEINEMSERYHAPSIERDDNAYICYTSGQTGLPKAVLVSYGSVFNTMNGIKNKNLPNNMKMISTAPANADSIIYDILTSIVYQAELHLIFPEGRYSATLLNQIIREDGIYFGVFFANVLNQLDPNCDLQYVVSMGAIPNENMLRDWKNTKHERIIQNNYGPTEIGICATEGDYDLNQDHMLIGKPINNMQIWILDNDGNVCPPGVPGLIYISGEGLAKGYANDKNASEKAFKLMWHNKTKQVFLASDDGFSTKKTLYATGDYGLYYEHQSELLIKILGRKSNDEVKIHGVRLNLESIKSIFLKYPKIKEVAILPNEALTCLSAYIVLNNIDNELEKELEKNLRQYLKTTPLPIVAYPKQIYFIPKQLPLTQNGKLDTKALPITKSAEVKYNPSANHLEKGLQTIWQKVLSMNALPPVDIAFDDLGGHSALLASLETIINQKKKELKIITKSYISIGTFLTMDMTISSLAKKLTPKSIINNTYIVGKNAVMFPSQSVKKSSSMVVKMPNSIN